MFEQPRPEQYIATALETQEQAKKTALNYCTHKFHPRWPVSHSSLAMFRSHVDMFSLCQGIFYVCVSGLCSLSGGFLSIEVLFHTFYCNFSGILAGLKKIVRYTEDFVIQRFVK